MAQNRTSDREQWLCAVEEKHVMEKLTNQLRQQDTQFNRKRKSELFVKSKKRTLIAIVKNGEEYFFCEYMF